MASRVRQGRTCYPGQSSDATKPIPAITPRRPLFSRDGFGPDWSLQTVLLEEILEALVGFQGGDPGSAAGEYLM